MSADFPPDALAAKIARLVEERGWNQEDFARITKLNRQTVRQILLGQGRKPHNATVQACARALGLSVAELRAVPLDKLLPRMHSQAPTEGDAVLRRLYEFATTAELRSWLERHEGRARHLTADEADELLQGQAAAAALGVDRFVEMLERRRRLIEQVKIVAGSELLGALEIVVGLMHDRVRPEVRSSEFGVRN